MGHRDAVKQLKLGGTPVVPQPVGKQMQRLFWLAFVLIGAIHSGGSALGRSMDPGEAAILRQVAPAVVSISVWKMRPPDQQGEPSRRVKTYGSGFIVDPSGIVVTNQHVIDKAIDVKAVLSDGTRITAKVPAASPMTVPAVLK